jgi:hypothetical protein
MNLSTLNFLKPNESVAPSHVDSVYGNVEAFTMVCEMLGLSSATAKCKRIIESLKSRKN